MHFLRQALHLLGCDPQETPDINDQLDAAHASVGMPNHITDERSVAEREYCNGLLGLPGEGRFHALGIAARSQIAPPSAGQVYGVATETRRLCVPIAFGRGSDTVWIPSGVALDVVKESVVRLLPDGKPFPDGTKYALCRWAGCYVIVGQPETRFEPVEPLVRGVDRWSVLKDLFEQDTPGVWADNQVLLELAKAQVDGVHLRDIQSARTMYRRGDMGEPLTWVVARIECMQQYKRGRLTEEMRKATAAPAAPAATAETPVPLATRDVTPDQSAETVSTQSGTTIEKEDTSEKEVTQCAGVTQAVAATPVAISPTQLSLF